jgi:hypothetical protein
MPLAQSIELPPPNPTRASGWNSACGLDPALHIVRTGVLVNAFEQTHIKARRPEAFDPAVRVPCGNDPGIADQQHTPCADLANQVPQSPERVGAENDAGAGLEIE